MEDCVYLGRSEYRLQSHSVCQREYASVGYCFHYKIHMTGRTGQMYKYRQTAYRLVPDERGYTYTVA